jgi:hypothetical protein
MRTKNISALRPECGLARQLSTLGQLAVLNVQKRSACIRAGGIVNISAVRPGVWGCPPLTPIWADLSAPSVRNARTLIAPPDSFAKMVTPRSTVLVAQNDGRTASPGVCSAAIVIAAQAGVWGCPPLTPYLRGSIRPRLGNARAVRQLSESPPALMGVARKSGGNPCLKAPKATSSR